jgi:glutamate/aspartate transport system substrate-binding protein
MRRVLAGALVLAALSVAAGVSAQNAGQNTGQNASQDGGLNPTLAAIKRDGVVRLGYREASTPFSFLDQARRPIGYSLDLCQAIVEEVGHEVDSPYLRAEYVKVTSDTRIQALLDSKIDFECGSTTNNAQRRQVVAFSPLIFVAGTRLMVPKAAKVSGIADLKGKTIVLTRGTTNQPAIEAADKKLGLGLKIVAGDDHEHSYQMLAEGKVDAFATDDILLYGLIARHRAQDRFEVVGDLLSYEPYGIMFRKDEPQLAAVVERTFRKLATNHDLVPLYEKWFTQRLPTGERLDVAMSLQLEAAFKALATTPTANQ